MADSVTLNVGINKSKILNDFNDVFSSVEKGIGSKGVNLKINEQSFRQPLGRISGDVSQFSRSLEAATARVVAFSATLGIIGGTVKIFSNLVDATVQVEKKLKDINAVFGLSSSGLKSFSKDIFDAARTTGQSFDDAAKAALEFSRQGLTAAETSKRVASALTLVRLSGLDVGKSVDTITTTLNGFNKEGLTSIEIINKLVAVDGKFAVSAQDLANALTRVGSSAQDAGVGFDKLIGLVTAARQITGREGAVIGNSLKTIFTRVQRADVLDQLDAFGVKVRDASGASLQADKILENLGQSFKALSKAQQSSVSELVGGVFQINQLKAILGDLGKQYNITADATQAAANASNEAAKRNEVLNQSLATLIQNSKTTATEIGAAFGNLSIAEPLRKLLQGGGNNLFGDISSSVVNGLKQIDAEKPKFENAGEEIAALIGKGLAKGLGNIISGPAVVFSGLLASKLIKLTGSKLLGEAGSLLNTNSTGTSLQKGQDVVLSRATDAELKRYQAASSVEAKEKEILLILERQAAVTAAQAGARLELTQTLAGFSGSTKNQLRTLGRAGFAGGYLPIAEESAAIRQGVGGASPNARPVVIPNFAMGGGKNATIVANSDEYIVPNFANGGSAIFNPNMVRSMGLPSGAVKIAADGYIPNFAGGPVGLRRGAVPIGEGVYGRVLRQKDSNFVFKAFKNEAGSAFMDKSAVDQFIREEFAISKVAEGLGLPIAKVFGTAKRSVDRRGIYKEFVDGTLGSKLPAKDRDEAIAELRARFKENGITPYDLHSENFMVRKGADLKDIKSIIKNSVVIDPGQFEVNDGSLLRKYNSSYYSKAGGYIPNFANNPLAAAFVRERAAGVPADQIYVDIDPRAKSVGNPQGIVVANRRDEPNGASQGVNRVLGQGGDPRYAGASRGYIPNFADDLRSSVDIAMGAQAGQGKSNLTSSYAAALKRAADEQAQIISEGVKSILLSAEKLANGLKPINQTVSATRSTFDTFPANKVLSNNQEAFNQSYLDAAITEERKKKEEAEAFRRKLFIGGKNAFGQKATATGSINTSAFDQIDATSTPRGYSPNLPSAPAPRLEATYVELQLKKQLSGLTNNQILNLNTIAGGSPTGPLRRGAGIQNIREELNEGPLSNFRNRTLVGLARSGTLNTNFDESVRGRLKGGESLESAFQAVSKEYLDAGGTAKQLKNAQTKLIYGLVQYEKTLIEEAANAQKLAQSKKRALEISSVENRAGINLQSYKNSIGGFLKNEGGSFDQLSSRGQTIVKAQLKRQATEELGYGNFNPSDLRKNATAQAQIDELTKAKLTQLTAKSPDTTALYKTLQTSTGIFGNFNKQAEKFLSSAAGAKLSDEEKGIVRNQANTLQSQRSQRNFQGALVASFALPAVAGFIDEGVGGTTSGKIRGGASGALQGAGTGLAAGSAFGAPGLLVGGIGGAVLGGIFGTLSKATKSFEELAKQIDNVNASNKRTTESISQYLQIQGQIEDLGPEANLSDRDKKLRGRLLEQQRQIIVTAPNEVRQSLIKGKSFDDLTQVLDAQNEKANKVFNEGNVLSSVGLFAKNNNKKNTEDATIQLASIFKNIDGLDKLVKTRDIYDTGINGSYTKSTIRELDKNKLQDLLKGTALSKDSQEELLPLLEEAFNKGSDVFEELIRQVGRGVVRNAKSAKDLEAKNKETEQGVNRQAVVNSFVRNLEKDIRTNDIKNSFGNQQNRANFDFGISNLDTSIESRAILQSNFEKKSASDLLVQTEESAFKKAQARTIGIFGKANLLDKQEEAQKATSIDDLKRIDAKTQTPQTKDALNDIFLDYTDVVKQASLNLEAVTKQGERNIVLAGIQARLAANQSTGNRIDNANQLDSVRAGANRTLLAQKNTALLANSGLSELSIEKQAGTNRLDAAKELASSTLKESFASTQANLIRSITKDSTFKASDIENAKTIEELQAIANSIQDQGAKESFSQMVETLRRIAATGEINVKLVADQNKISEDQLKLTQVNNQRIASVFNSGTTARFGSLGVNSVNRGSTIGAGLGANQDLERISVLNRLSIPETDQSKALTRTLQNTSSRSTYAQLLSSRLGRDVGTNELGAASKEFSKKAVGTVEKVEADRLEKAIERLENDILSNPNVDVTPGRQSGPAGEFFSGFKEKFVQIKGELNSLAEVGKQVGDSLESNLGNAFGDFVTGAKSGKDAFRSFTLGVLNDASRAFASQAIRSLLGAAFGGFTAPLGRNSGGEIPRFAQGGSVPALLTGGEYYFGPQAVSSIGKDTLAKMNQGLLDKYATGGLVRGGSGVVDDVPARLDGGGYVLKKSAVSKYGADYLDSLAQGHVQKKFFGGMLLGGLLGAGIGYATGGKKGALIGGLLGGVAGGFAQNYAQTGNLLKSGTNSNFFSFAKQSSSVAGNLNLSSTAGYSDGVPDATGQVAGNASNTVGAAAKVATPLSNFQKIGIGLGISAALGIGSSLLSPKIKEGKIMNDAEISANRVNLEAGQSNLNQYQYLQLNPQGGYSSLGSGPQIATRRFSEGGRVEQMSMAEMSFTTNQSPINRLISPISFNNSSNINLAQSATKQEYPVPSIMISPRRFADGGSVDGNASMSVTDAPKASVNEQTDNNSKVNITITINNQGQASSETSTDTSNPEFANKLGKAVEGKVMEVLNQQSRNGGFFSQQKRFRN
jgi:TP901 family phage tail tape measure protein